MQSFPCATELNVNATLFEMVLTFKPEQEARLKKCTVRSNSEFKL